MTPQEIKQTRLDAAELAQKADLKMRAVGDGLFNLQGQEFLMCAKQIVALLAPTQKGPFEAAPKKPRKTRSDKGRPRVGKGAPTVVFQPPTTA